ncbi:MAG: hypothetical protein AB7D16_11325, partial [Eubacteriaceae bacterium]
WQLVFIHIHLFIIYLAFISCHCQTAPTLPRSINLFCFLWVGNPKTALKGGYLGRRGGSSFASRWVEGWLPEKNRDRLWGLQMCLRLCVG